MRWVVLVISWLVLGLLIWRAHHPPKIPMPRKRDIVFRDGYMIDENGVAHKCDSRPVVLGLKAQNMLRRYNAERELDLDIVVEDEDEQENQA